MASVYLDTSALLKLYIAEEGTEQVIEAAEGAADGHMVMLAFTPLEARSAIRRREREGDIASADADRALRKIEDDCSTLFLTQPLSSPVMEEAARLIDRHPLRAYDALQLAGCLVVREGYAGAGDVRLCRRSSLRRGGERGLVNAQPGRAVARRRRRLCPAPSRLPERRTFLLLTITIIVLNCSSGTILDQEQVPCVYPR